MPRSNPILASIKKSFLVGDSRSAEISENLLAADCDIATHNHNFGFRTLMMRAK